MWCSQVPRETDLGGEVSGVRTAPSVYSGGVCELCQLMYGSRNGFSQMYSQQQTINYHLGVRTGASMAKTSAE